MSMHTSIIVSAMTMDTLERIVAALRAADREGALKSRSGSIRIVKEDGPLESDDYWPANPKRHVAVGAWNYLNHGAFMDVCEAAARDGGWPGEFEVMVWHQDEMDAWRVVDRRP